MRVFGCLLLACLAIGAYGAALDNLEKLERRLLVDLLEARSGGDSGPPPCDADHVGEAQDWPKECDSSDPCTCTFTCVEDGSGGYKHSATPINDGFCPPAPCDANRDGDSVQYPKDCQNTDTCTCTLTCEDEVTASGETEWEWTEDGDDCPSNDDDDDDKRDMDLLENRSGGNSGPPCEGPGDVRPPKGWPKDCGDLADQEPCTCNIYVCTALTDENGAPVLDADGSPEYGESIIPIVNADGDDGKCPCDDPDICAVKDGSVTFVYLPRPQPQAADDVTKRGHGGQNKFKLILQYLITEYALIGNVPNCGVVDVADFVCVNETKNAWKIRFEGDPRADDVFNAVDNACE